MSETASQLPNENLVVTESSKLEESWKEFGVETSEVVNFKDMPFSVEGYLQDKYEIAQADEILEQMFEKYLEWKNSLYKDELNGPFEMVRLDTASITEEGLRLCMEEFEVKELALKASVSTINPLYIDPLLDADETTSEIILGNADERRAIALQIPLERVSQRLETEEAYRADIIRRFGLHEYLERNPEPSEVIHELREKIRAEFFYTCEKLNISLKTTANYHVSGAVAGQRPEVAYMLPDFLEDIIDRLKLTEFPEGEAEAYKEIIMGFAPFEVQKSKLVKLSEIEDTQGTTSEKWGAIEQGGTINHVNNALSHSVLDRALEMGKTPGVLVLVEKNVYKQREGFDQIEHPKKDTSFLAKFANSRATLSLNDFDISEAPEYTPPKNVEPLSLKQLRCLQAIDMENFITPKQRETHLLQQIRNGEFPTSRIYLSSKERGSHGEEPEVLMPDITGYSKIAEVLGDRYNINAEEVVVPFVRTASSISQKYGALSGNWAGDSLHFVMLRNQDIDKYAPAAVEAYKGTSPQERSIMFYLELNQAHEDFIKDMEQTAGEEFMNRIDSLSEDPEIRAKELEELIAGLSLEISERKDDRLVAQAFVTAKESLTSKKYGLKAISTVESLCQVRQTSLAGPAGKRHEDVLVSNFKSVESISTAEFDKVRSTLESDTNGESYVISDQTYESFKKAAVKDLFIKTSHGYRLDEVAASNFEFVL